jgi:hypothetical protein
MLFSPLLNDDNQNKLDLVGTSGNGNTPLGPTYEYHIHTLASTMWLGLLSTKVLTRCSLTDFSTDEDFSLDEAMLDDE